MLVEGFAKEPSEFGEKFGRGIVLGVEDILDSVFPVHREKVGTG